MSKNRPTMLIVELALAAFAYGLLTARLFGDPLKPIALATLWSDRLGLENWRMLAALCVAASALVFLQPIRTIVPKTLRSSAFVILAILLSTACVGLQADRARHRAILEFSADEVEEQSFFASVTEAPAEFQYFLHTAALKNCKPYAWSYRNLEFYMIPPRAAINVLPRSWIERCRIQVEEH